MEYVNTANPYGSLFSSGLDQVLVWSAVIIVMACVGWAIAKMRRIPEGVFERVLRTLLIASLLPSAVFIPGLAGMLFNIDSILWIFWQLLFLLATIAVFWVLPAMMCGMLVWGLLGKLLQPQRWRHAKTLAAVILLQGFNAGTYFVLVAIAAKHA